MKKLEQLNILKQLDPIYVFLFLILRSVCNQNGKVPLNLQKLITLTRGAKICGGERLSLSTRSIHYRLKRMAYEGLLKEKQGAERDRDKKIVAYQNPITLTEEFLVFLPDHIANMVPRQEYEDLKSELEESEAIRSRQHKRLQKAREKAKQARSVFTPEIKMHNKDGSINKRSVEFRKLWAWFELLEISQAFVKMKEVNEDSDAFEATADYKLMGVWLSSFGMDLMEEVFLRFYNNKRLDALKHDAGDEWPDAVVRYLYKTFQGVKKEKKSEDDVGDYQYVPRKK